MMSKRQKIFLCTIVGLSIVEWGLLPSMLPPFYPKEAESKGCTPDQVICIRHECKLYFQGLGIIPFHQS